MKHFAVISLVILCASCASAPWQEVPLPPQPFVLKGFSFMSPDEPGWRVNTRLSPDRSSLVKSNHDTDPYENYVIAADVLNVPEHIKSNEEFLRGVKEGRAINNDPRYKILTQDINPHMQNGKYCVLSQVVAEDHGGGQIQSFGFGIHRRPGYMIFEGVTLTCRHPQNNSVALDLTFSLRYYPGERDPLFSEKAMKVVDSVEFRNP